MTVRRSFDVSKFRKSLTKSIPGITEGFNDPDTWISTGNFALNYLLSGDFNKGIPLGKVTILAGESGSGKSFLASGNVVRNAQEQGIFVVLFDSENALDEEWLQALGVDTSPEKLMRISVSMVNDVAQAISEFVKDYKKEYTDVPKEERPKVLFVIDSLGMLLTPADLGQFEAGDLKGNMGWSAKQLKALVKNCVVQFGALNLGLVATNHTYASQDMFDPDDKISGGCLIADTQLYDADGVLVKIQDVTEGMFVMTTLGPRQVTKTYIYENKEICEIEFEDGYKVKCTPEHFFLVQNDDDVAWKPASDLQVDDHVVEYGVY